MTTIPFSDSALATSDANGNITFNTFQLPRMLEWRQGSLSVVGADGSTVVPGTVLPITWKAFVGSSTIWGTWYNDQPSNLVQTNGPSVTVKGVNLTALTAYQCIFTGYDSDSPPALSPLPAPAPPPSGPVTLVNLSAFLPGAGSSLLPSFPSQAAPVVVGTSLEVILFDSTTNSGKLTIYWSQTPGGAQTAQFSFEVANDALLTPQGSSAGVLSGLVLPNLGPFVHITAANATPGSGTIDAIINTGLPPITRPPIVPGGILTFAQAAAVAGGGAITYNLPPYDGDVCLSATMSGGTINQLDAQVTAFDYLGNTNRSVLIDSTQLVAGVVPTIPPTWFSLPPKVCQITFTNRDTVAHDITHQLVAAGP